MSFPIVGVGASAGGVEALQSFFENVPDKSGVAFVVVTHLSPDRDSLLHEIIARCTALPVKVAEDAMEVRPNAVYVLPARAVLGFSEGRLRLRTPEPGERERRPIDIFLSALAKDRKEYSVAVILSGGDADGALGVKAVKEHGGLTMAQVADGHPPRYPEMPESAILTGMVDFALPVTEMGARLAEFSRSFTALSAIAIAADAAPLGDATGHAAIRDEICALLRNQTGHDFSGYKSKTFFRRVMRRMQVNHLSTLSAYVELLRREPKEAKALFRDLLINVTNFFRDAEAFEALGTLVIPKLFEGRGADESVRVWVPGCATGEEVFSIAILMREHMDGLRNVPRVQIFATDIDDRALAVARGSRYPEALLDSVSEERRRRFFITDGGSCVVSRDVRDLCVFSPHSVLRDPPFSHIDLVSCRNLLIYFGPEAQGLAIPTFHYSLRAGGHLFLGASENVSQFKDLFVPIDKKNRLFRAREDGSRPARLSLPGLRWPAVASNGGHGAAMSSQPLRQTVQAHVIERHAPPHVVVNGEGDIVHFSSRTGKYFEAPAGAPNRQLLPMARKGLRLDLRGLMQEAMETNQLVRRGAVEFDGDGGGVQRLELTAEPLPGTGDERLILITFNDRGPALSAEEAMNAARGDADAHLALERELRDTRDRLQSMIEEYETALEELKSSNEELLSVNEEMQSTNEELEASKEELQSVNEELQTVNMELNAKVEALDHANSDLHNLFESTEVATVFLDKRLAIRKFTPAASTVFNVLPGDIGRPLTDLTSRLVYPGLAGDLAIVLNESGVLERQTGGAGRDAHYITRIAAYRDGDGRIDGVVVTVMDVSSLAQAEIRQRTLIAELNHRVKNMLAVVLALAYRTKNQAPSLDAFYAAFSGRLGAMSRSYELLSRESWTEVSLEEIVRQELTPFGMERVTLDMEPLRLNPRQGLSMGMIIHELATNAAKHGALSAERGVIELVASRAPAEEAGDIRISWREGGGPAVGPRAKDGFGLQLVERETSYNLRGVSDIEFAPDGLRVTLVFAQEQGTAE